MEQLLIWITLTLVGLCMGSFAGATVWRLRARQLAEDKKQGEKINSKEYKRLSPLAMGSLTDDRSRCLHCGHALAWYDLLPLVSWASTKGKCRYCHEKIGWFEPLMELGVAAFFIFSYVLWPGMLESPIEITHFVLWLVAGVMLAILFAYDLKWFLLPNYVVFPLIGLGVVIALLGIIDSPNIGMTLINISISVLILSGLYFILWLISKGRWIGFGDVKLGLALALLLSDWQLAFIALFAANLIGTLIVIPGMVRGKVTRSTRVPFGPLLIAGTIVAALIGRFILDQYFMLFIPI